MTAMSDSADPVTISSSEPTNESSVLEQDPKQHAVHEQQHQNKSMPDLPHGGMSPPKAVSPGKHGASLLGGPPPPMSPPAQPPLPKDPVGSPPRHSNSMGSLLGAPNGATP